MQKAVGVNNALEMVFKEDGPHQLGGRGGPCPHKSHLLTIALDQLALDPGNAGAVLPNTGFLQIYSDLKSPGYSPEHANSCLVQWKNEPVATEAATIPDRRIGTVPCQILPGRRSLFATSQGPWRDSNPGDHLLGFPFPEQHNQMELQAELTSRGIYTGRSLEIPSNLDADEVFEGALDWRLLLQLQSKPELDLMFGDQGTLYLFIRQQDLLRRDFSSVWQIIQS